MFSTDPYASCMERWLGINLFKDPHAVVQLVKLERWNCLSQNSNGLKDIRIIINNWTNITSMCQHGDRGS